jgi:hypothetical protein
MNSIKHPLLESLLFHLPVRSGQSELSLQKMNPEIDLPLVFEWVNQPYAIPFWQMNGSYQQLADAFINMEQSYGELSLAGYRHGELVCQLDIYDPFTDPIKDCYSPLKGDMGVHLLVAPGKKPVPDFTAKLLYFLLECLFRYSGILRIIGEPDEANEAANRLLQKLSFQFHQVIQLPSKKANFYTISRNQFASLPGDTFTFS